MASQSRKHRGMKSQLLVAQWYAERGWPYAQSAGGGRGGVDVTGVPGLRVEVKARRGFSPLAWLRQARSAPGNGVPFAVFRCDGQGEKSVGEWGVLMTLADHTALLHEAGYGSPQQHTDGPQDQGKETQDDHALHPVLRSATDLTAAHDVKSATEEAHTD